MHYCCLFLLIVLIVEPIHGKFVIVSPSTVCLRSVCCVSHKVIAFDNLLPFYIVVGGMEELDCVMDGTCGEDTTTPCMIKGFHLMTKFQLILQPNILGVGDSCDPSDFLLIICNQVTDGCLHECACDCVGDDEDGSSGRLQALAGCTPNCK